MRQTHRPDYPLSTSTRLHAPSTILPAISFASGKPSSAKPEAALKRLPHRTFWNQTIENARMLWGEAIHRQEASS